MKIEFVDLKAQYLSIKDEINSCILNVFEKSSFVSGPFVKSFEENFARAHNVKYCVCVNSGTSALHIAMWALGIKEGDEVILPTFTFFATPEAVSLCGAKPVFVDIEEEYFNIDPELIEMAITPKTKAIIAVHLYGQPAQLDKIKAIAEKNNLLLIEDCAQAHLAEYKRKKVGSFGICGCFSFYPGKNLGAYGEGGAVLTNDSELYLKMLALRDHGSLKKYYHDYIGHNYRMEGIQGAILDVKLKYLNDWTEKRRKNAILYRKYLAEIKEVALPLEMPDTKHVYHLFVIRTPKRDELIKYLQDNGIFAGIHYPVPCHLQKAYRFLNYQQGQFPISERYANCVLSLPMFPELTEAQIQFVFQKVKEFFNSL
ncbi:TPA: erythromycin biosynthesis sensory transduction protein eryC1 [bacterium]|nr:erythromycin biosynthesis sensory transduction protein eryC1 [bacterium]